MPPNTSAEQRHSALASRTRREILALLGDTANPLGAAGIAERCDIHVTTVRFHLGQLERAGLIRREVVRGGGRGRPGIVFRAVPGGGEGSPLRQLNRVLAGALNEEADGGRARAKRAGEGWLQALTDEADAAGAVPLMLTVFERLGFAPQLRQDGRTALIALPECPFRDVAAAYPEVVCSAHRGLLEGIVARSGHATDEAVLEPFVEPELCVVRLRGALATAAAEEPAGAAEEPAGPAEPTTPVGPASP